MAELPLAASGAIMRREASMVWVCWALLGLIEGSAAQFCSQQAGYVESDLDKLRNSFEIERVFYADCTRQRTDLQYGTHVDASLIAFIPIMANWKSTTQVKSLDCSVRGRNTHRCCTTVKHIDKVRKCCCNAEHSVRARPATAHTSL
ncbi:hypothetical protein DOTSEDRAFT_70360 [Dothistroma septosporum NZE10]|uniref:Uncharacterized protein n=1 Tax=Dothistroma septosporum (strain NZE10 / CBS 128990) TaxID=675120 RepID=N1PSH8_DOTSN|nr:hypothetical protein DOTSEDRAFT_70360 [Dothistroma septosporum NZE10]